MALFFLNQAFDYTLVAKDCLTDCVKTCIHVDIKIVPEYMYIYVTSKIVQND